MGLGQGVFGEGVGQLELADDRQRIDARLAQRPEHLGDHALAVAELGGKADHVDHDFVVLADVLRPGVADGDRLGEHRAVDADVAGAARLEVGADELMRLPPQDLDDLALGPAIGGAAASGDQPDLDQVAGRGVESPFGRDVDVGHFRLGPAAPVGRTKP